VLAAPGATDALPSLQFRKRKRDEILRRVRLAAEGEVRSLWL
jgi:hypothetical protein